MPELRRDPVVGYWTIISTERSLRPVELNVRPRVENGSDCPFCEGREGQTPGEIYALREKGSKPNGPGWQVRVVPSKVPVFLEDKPIERYGHGLYDLMEGAGKHEIIVEIPRHVHDLDEMPSSQVERVIQVYLDRLLAMERDDRFKYALLFKNHGLIFGSSKDLIRHARSQIIGMPIIPKRVKEELATTKSYFERHERCVFCDILRQERRERVRVVGENDSFFAFCPFASRAPFEVWISPKKHSADFGHLDTRAVADFAALLVECLKKMRMLLNDPPFNSILHTAPFRHRLREIYWKTIEEDYHWYYQISPRLTQSAGFEWGTGIHINPTPPEEAATLLRETSVR